MRIGVTRKVTSNWIKSIFKPKYQVIVSASALKCAQSSVSTFRITIPAVWIQLHFNEWDETVE